MFEIHINHCLPHDFEALEAFLEQTGSLSMTLCDEADSPIFEPEIGTTPLWPKVIVQALYASYEDAMHALFQVKSHFPSLEVTLITVPEQDWQRINQAEFEPQCYAGRLWISPSWHTPPNDGLPHLTLDPGLAFGTGKHPTTRLCLQYLAEHALNDMRMMDYGCGSGILALAALKLGARFVDAIDIDEQALIATNTNATQNHIQEKLAVHFPEEAKGPVDIIIANILLAPLITLKTSFHELLEKQGLLVVSGILQEQVPQLIEAYQDYFTAIETQHLEEWALIVFQCAQ